MSNRALANVSSNQEEEDVEERCNYFPPGFRFKPYDYELILNYLKPKLLNLPLPPNRILDVDLYNYNPAQLVGSYESYGEGNWYCFTPRKKKYRNGSRPDRAAGDGYWKATGADKIIKSEEGVEIGRKKALVFYSGKALKGQKTDWMMYEYKLSDPPILSNPSQDHMQLDDWILCKIYKNNASKKRSLALASANIGTEEFGLLPGSNGPTFDIGSERVQMSTMNGPTFDIGSEQVQMSTMNGPTFDIGSEQVQVSIMNGPTFGSEQVEVPSSTLYGPTFGSEHVEVASTTWNGPPVDAGSKEIEAVPISDDDFFHYCEQLTM